MRTDSETQNQTLRGSGYWENSKKELNEAEGSMMPQENIPQNQLTRTHRDSQRLTQPSQNLHGSTLIVICAY